MDQIIKVYSVPTKPCATGRPAVVSHMARKQGRPPIEDDGLKRNQVLRSSATQAERQFLELCASNQRQSLSAWLIDGALLAATKRLSAPLIDQFLVDIRESAGDAGTDELAQRLDALRHLEKDVSELFEELRAEMRRSHVPTDHYTTAEQARRGGPKEWSGDACDEAS